MKLWIAMAETAFKNAQKEKQTRISAWLQQRDNTNQESFVSNNEDKSTTDEINKEM